MGIQASWREHISSKYGIPAELLRRGTPARAFGRSGRITAMDGSYVRMLFEGDKRPTVIHPLEIAYNGETDQQVQQRSDRMQQRIDRFNAALNGR
jgi:hypothetical protein